MLPKNSAGSSIKWTKDLCHFGMSGIQNALKKVETIQLLISQLAQLSLFNTGIPQHLQAILHRHTWKWKRKEKIKDKTMSYFQLKTFDLFLWMYSFYTGLECHSCPILVCWWIWMHFCLPRRTEFQGLSGGSSLAALPSVQEH